MRREIRILRRAKEEVQNSLEWYEERSPGLGVRWVEVLDKTSEAISRNPFQYPTKRPPYREAWVKDFPFVVLFQVSDAVVYIESVFHTSRNPSTKFGRE